jgi:signal transduction histidine kinase
MPRGGKIRVDAERVSIGEHSTLPLEAGAFVRVTVVDEGEGIDSENLGRVFEPYNTTRDEGSGLGLASVHSIARSHGGSADVESVRGAGATFTLYLRESGSVALRE